MCALTLSLTHTHTPGIIPRSWRRYTVPSGLTVIQWVSDFSERIKQLQTSSQQVANHGSKVLKVSYHGMGNGILGNGEWGMGRGGMGSQLVQVMISHTSRRSSDLTPGESFVCLMNQWSGCVWYMHQPV